MLTKRVLSIVLNDLKNDNRVLNQAFSLASRNYEVTLLGIQRVTTLSQIEVHESLIIQRIALNDKLINRIRYLRGLCFLFYSWIKVLNVAKNQFEIVHCHDLNTLQFGVFIKLFLKRDIRLIYDAHEYETQRNGLKGLKRIYVLLKEPFLIKFCDRLITVSDTIAEEYKRLYQIQKPAIVLNCPILKSDELVKKDLFREIFNIRKDQRIFLYQGYLSPGRGIEVLLNSFGQLNREDLVLVFMGEGTLENLISNHPKFNSQIFCHPFVSGDTLLCFTSSANYGIAFIEDISLSDRYCLPNKLFEYIAAGLPVLGSGLPDLSKFIFENGIGVTAKSNDINGFIRAIDQLLEMNLDELHENILDTRTKYNWQTQERVLLDTYLQLF